jgi:methylenetetrahydrofolate dehydrogenase (NADP+)/methenyltetrahydrofolate cyclohydrolase
MARILDGKKLARAIKTDVKKQVKTLNSNGVDVGLALLLVGGNPASVQYFQATIRTCKKVGITAYEFRLPLTVSVNEILNVVHSINEDERIHGLLILMPLPSRINARRVINAISPEKDVDGLGAISVGRLAADESTFQLFASSPEKVKQHVHHMPSIWSFLPCTPFGVMRLLEHHKVTLKGKHAVVIGKSLAVGKPLATMLLAKEATVSICHRETKNLAHYTRHADILCTATGKAGLIKKPMVKKGAVIVDIGISIRKNGSITGDADFESVSKQASMITPVPGGVGPVTIAMLLENTVRSAQRNELFKSPLMI